MAKDSIKSQMRGFIFICSGLFFLITVIICILAFDLPAVATLGAIVGLLVGTVYAHFRASRGPFIRFSSRSFLARSPVVERQLNEFEKNVLGRYDNLKKYAYVIILPLIFLLSVLVLIIYSKNGFYFFAWNLDNIFSIIFMAWLGFFQAIAFYQIIFSCLILKNWKKLRSK